MWWKNVGILLLDRLGQQLKKEAAAKDKSELLDHTLRG